MRTRRLQLRTHTPRRGRRAASRRGFAIVLVVMLTLIVGLGIAILFQRHGVAALAARRQADDYMTRHAGLGMREMVSRWLTTVRGKLAESLDDDGFAFTLNFSDGQRIDVYMKDAQGSALIDTSGLTGRRREIVELMKFYLEALPEEQRQQVTRRHGPSEISLASAPPEVLLALAQAIVGVEKAADVADAVTKRRDERLDSRSADRHTPAGMNNGMNNSRTVPVDQIVRVLSESNVEPAKIAEFQAMLAATPTLWFATAELKGVGAKVVDRAGGLIEINTARSDPFNQNGPFITWETLPLDEGLDGGTKPPSGR